MMDLCPKCGSDRLAFAHGRMEHDGNLVLNGPYFICQRCGWEDACTVGWARRFVPPRPLLPPSRTTPPKPATPPSPLYLRALAVHMHVAAPQSALGDRPRRDRIIPRAGKFLFRLMLGVVTLLIAFAIHGSFSE